MAINNEEYWGFVPPELHGKVTYLHHKSGDVTARLSDRGEYGRYLEATGDDVEMALRALVQKYRQYVPDDGNMTPEFD